MGGCSSGSSRSHEVEKISRGVQVTPVLTPPPSPPPSPPPPVIHVKPEHDVILISIPYKPLDLKAYDNIFEDVDFADLLNIDATVFDIVDAELSPLKKTNKNSFQKQIMPDDQWNAQYFAHGDSSDVIVEVNSQRHGCIKSSESQDINIESEKLRIINMKIEQLIIARIREITKREEKKINQHIETRNIIIGEIVNKESSYIQEYDKQYRKLLEEYIVNLEKAIIPYLDELHKRIKDDQRLLFNKSQAYISDLTFNAQKVRKDFLKKIYLTANQRINQLFLDTNNSFVNIKHQPLGREELRTINFRLYSTVGEKLLKQDSENIPDRDKFMKEIDDKKKVQHHPKGTVYLGSNPNIPILRSQINQIDDITTTTNMNQDLFAF